MEYKEKVRLAESAIISIKNGKSLEDIKGQLTDSGLSENDSSEVVRSVKKGLELEYEEVIRKLVLNGQESEVDVQVPNLDASHQSVLVAKVKKEVHGKLRRSAKKLIGEGKSTEEIKSQLANAYTSQEELDLILITAAAQISNESTNNSKMIGGIVLGLLMIAVGVGLSIGTDRVFYGLVVGGIAVMGGAAFAK